MTGANMQPRDRENETPARVEFADPGENFVPAAREKLRQLSVNFPVADSRIETDRRPFRFARH